MAYRSNNGSRRGGSMRRGNGRRSQQNGNGRSTNGGNHFHPYNSYNQGHMSRHGSGRVNSPSTYRHGPHGANWQDYPHPQNSGSMHTHRFSEDVNQHWGRYPGGNHQAPLTGSNFGYRHRHLQGPSPLNMIPTGSMNRGRRGGGRRY